MSILNETTAPLSRPPTLCLGTIKVEPGKKSERSDYWVAPITCNPLPGTAGVIARTNLLFIPEWFHASFSPKSLELTAEENALAETARAKLKAGRELTDDEAAAKARFGLLSVFQNNVQLLDGNNRPNRRARIVQLLGYSGFDQFIEVMEALYAKDENPSPEKVMTALIGCMVIDRRILYATRQAQMNGEPRDADEVVRIYSAPSGEDDAEGISRMNKTIATARKNGVEVRFPFEA